MVSLEQVVALLGAEVQATRLDNDVAALDIGRPASLSSAGPGEFTFLGATARDPQRLLKTVRAGVLLVERSIETDGDALASQGVRAVLAVPNARLAFIKVVEHFFIKRPAPGVHPSAVVAPTARLAPSASVGPLCTIGDGAIVGENTVLHAGVHVGSRVRIGQGVEIHPGCVIGSDGFGFERDAQGRVLKFPHIGSVLIEDEVEIFALTHIARGTLDDTVIRKGARIDALCHISHNVEVGENALVVANAMVGGGVRIGPRAWIGPSSSIIDRVAVGDDAFLGMATNLAKPLAAGSRVMGSPARDVAEYKRLLGIMRRQLADEEVDGT